jgi:hypothetical protein
MATIDSSDHSLWQTFCQSQLSRLKTSQDSLDINICDYFYCGIRKSRRPKSMVWLSFVRYYLNERMALKVAGNEDTFVYLLPDRPVAILSKSMTGSQLKTISGIMRNHMLPNLWLKLALVSITSPS